jgi:phage shock protein C
MKIYQKRLYRSRDNKVIWGVMGGFGEYFDRDPVLFRALYTVVSILTGLFPGIFAYIFMSIIIPKEKEIIYEAEVKK